MNLDNLNENELNALKEQTGRIVANLKAIGYYREEFDLDALAAQVQRIYDKLEQVRAISEELGEKLL
jgi:hypothetical protein